MKKLYFLLASLSTMAAFAQPANDECTGAIPVPVNPNYTCGIVVPGTVAGATASVGAPGVSGTGTPDNDVWFSFVATNTTHRISLTNVSGTGSDLVQQVIAGECGQLASVSISDPETSTVNGLTVGETYYLRVFSYFANNNHVATFNVCIGTPPAPPANDDCGGAIPVAVNADLSCGIVTPGTIAMATASNAPSGSVGTPNDDVWFSFIATHSTHEFKLLNIVGDRTDLVQQILTGDCQQLASVTATDDEIKMISGLTPGELYYLRVYNWYSTQATTTTFNVCIGTPPPPPANDFCEGSIEVAVNADLNCTDFVSGTLASATASNVPDNGAGTPSDDVWFHFTATATSHVIALSNIQGSVTNMVHEVMSGDCADLTSVLISDPNTSLVNGLTVGNTYYVRVFSYQSAPATNTTFDLCISTPPTLTNDDCEDAIELTVNADENCSVVTAGALMGATQSNVPDNGGGTPDDDVWFSFVATNTAHIVKILNVSGSPTDLAHEILSGDCATLTSMYISDPDSSLAGGLVPGETYYVRIFSWSANTSATTTFNVCIATPPPAPANDDCSGAIALTPAATLAQSAIDATVEWATGSTGVANPTCASYNGGDVWFTVEVPASGSITVQTTASSTGITGFDSGMAVYEGTCGTLTQISCNDDGGSNSFSKISLTGRTPGEVIYVRVWEYSNDDAEPFAIGAYDASLSAPTFDSAGFRVYPNPVSDILNLTAQMNIETVEVFNLVGQQVFAKTINQTDYSLDMSQLPGGTYIVRATSGGASKTVKILKK
jgi:hypothetical protein